MLQLSAIVGNRFDPSGSFQSTRHKQSGFSMILVLVLLAIAMSASGYFYNRAVSDTKISAANRDNTGSLLLAESAMEMLRGRLLNGMDDDYGGEADTCTDSCEILAIANDKDIDMGVSADVQAALAEVDYAFYVGNGNGVSQTSPTLLQKVANSQNASLGSEIRVASQEVAVGTNELLIEDLFSGTYTPILYTTGPNGNCSNATDNSYGMLVVSACASWDAQLAAANYNGSLAAAWTEITQNSANPNALDLWVQATAQVGYAKSYVQRYVGTFLPGGGGAGGGLTDIGVLVEAANFDRRIQP